MEFLNNTNSSSSCRYQPKNLAVKGLYSSLIILIILLSSFGLPANTLLIIAVQKSQIWAVKTRLLINNISFTALLSNIYFFYQFFTFTRHYLFLLGGQEFQPIPALACALREAPAIGNLSMIMILSLFSIGIERWIATKKTIHQSKTTESGPVTSWPVICSLLMSWMTSIGCNLAVIFLVRWLNSAEALCFCQYLLVLHPCLYFGFVSSYMAVEISLSLFFYYILYKNRTELADFALNRSKTQSLNHRYKLWETIRITEILFPTVLAHSIIWILAGGASLIVVINRLSLREPEKLVLSDNMIVLYLLVPFLIAAHAAVHPYLVIRQSPTLRESIRKSVCGKLCFGAAVAPNECSKANVVSYHVSPQAHNDLMEQFWKL